MAEPRSQRRQGIELLRARQDGLGHGLDPRHQAVSLVYGQGLAQPRKVLRGVVHAFAQATKIVCQAFEGAMKARNQRAGARPPGPGSAPCRRKCRERKSATARRHLVAEVQPQSRLSGWQKTRASASPAAASAEVTAAMFSLMTGEKIGARRCSTARCPACDGDEEGLVDEAVAEGRDRCVFPVREMAKDLVTQ